MACERWAADMRLRSRNNAAASLSPWADDWVTSRERDLLGDQQANALAFTRHREACLHRPRFVLDFDTSVTLERPTNLDRSPDDTTALEVLSWRAAQLAGHLMPWTDAR